MLVDDTIPELTIIDLDGAGLLGDSGDEWAYPPLVAGQSQVPGFPPPSENSERQVYRETDYWWTAMLVFYISTSVTPFFFLQYTTPSTLLELAELLETATTREWPPAFELVGRHSRFKVGIRAQDFEMVAEQARQICPTNALHWTLGPGYNKRRTRVPAGFLLRELRGLAT